MVKNMSLLDRAFRVLLAIAVILLFVNGYVGGTAGAVLISISVVFVATAFINYCPLYSVFGIKRWEKKVNNKA
jgi:hypothetical protein